MGRHVLPYRDLTVGVLLSRLAESCPENEALVSADRKLRMTFIQLETEARLIARGLMACGVERGERVVVWAPNLPEWVVLQFALAKIGAILVTANTGLRGREIDYLLQQSGAATVITCGGGKSEHYIAVLEEIGAVGEKMLPDLKRIISITGERDRAGREGVMAYCRLRELAADVSEQELDDREGQVGLDDVINMQYTSDGAEFPKGVMLSNRNIVNNGYWLGQGLGYTPRDRLCLCVPLFHCFGCVAGVLGAYTHGASLCLIESFDTRKVLETIEQERCTSLYGVPTMFLAELEDPEFKRFDLSSLRTGAMGGAPCPETLIRRVIDEMNLGELTVIYGLTEASPVITQSAGDDSLERRTQTVGKALPELEVKVVDPVTREAVGANTNGELCVRGYSVMKGYYNNPEATRAAIDDEGWLRTGDQAVMDEQGYVRITGRIKNIIIRGGENISPKEVEGLLRQHPAVSDLYVYGVESEFYGEEVAAAVQLKPDAGVTGEELEAFCRGKIARFKIPKYFRLVDDFARTTLDQTQKIDDQTLRNAAAAQMIGQVELPSRSASAAGYVRPRNELEYTIASIWQDLLVRKQIGVHDDFLKLGGNSLSTIQLFSRLRKVFQVELPVRNLMDMRTIAQQADLIATIQWASQSAEPPRSSDVMPCAVIEGEL